MRIIAYTKFVHIYAVCIHQNKLMMSTKRLVWPKSGPSRSLPCLPPVLYSWHGVKFLQRSSIEGNAHQNIKGFSSEGAPQATFNSFYTREATFTTRGDDWQDKDDLHKH